MTKTAAQRISDLELKISKLEKKLKRKKNKKKKKKPTGPGVGLTPEQLPSLEMWHRGYGDFDD